MKYEHLPNGYHINSQTCKTKFNYQAKSTNLSGNKQDENKAKNYKTVISRPTGKRRSNTISTTGKFYKTS